MELHIIYARSYLVYIEEASYVHTYDEIMYFNVIMELYEMLN